MSRRLIYAVAGACAAVALLVTLAPDAVRLAFADGPQKLNAAAGIINAAQDDADAVVRTGCRYDTTPVAVGDGDDQAILCTQDGALAVSPVAGGAALEVQGDQVDLGGVARSTLACDDNDSDGPTTTLNAATVSFLLQNADTADDICITFGTGGGGDTTDPTACDILLGPWAGSGTVEQWASPAGLRYGGEAIRCEAPAGQTANLVVTQISTE